VEALAVEGEGLGRSRGGLTSKIHLAVDGRGLPMSILVTPGQAGDNPELLPLLDQVSVRPAWGGRPRRRPRRVIADKAYSHPGYPPGAPSPAHRVHVPGTPRPDRPPQGQRPRRWPPTSLRPGHLQEAQRRRAVLRSAQTVPWPRHPLRQTRRLLPSRSRHRHHRPLAPPRFAGQALAGPSWLARR
jgi:transposase